MPPTWGSSGSGGFTHDTPGRTWAFAGPRHLGVPYQRYYGVGDISGRVNALGYDPTEANIFHAGAATGVWKSTSGGKSWIWLSSPWTQLAVNSIMVDPDKTNTLYAARGDYHGWIAGASTGTVKLGATVRAATTVTLASNTVEIIVPVSVTIPASGTSVTFTAKTLPVSASVTGTVKAKLGSNAATGTLTVNAPVLSSLSVSTATVRGSSAAVVTGTVTLSGATPAAGTVIRLLSSNATATVPASVTVRSGHTTAMFTVRHSKVTTSRTVTLMATLGSVTKTATLTVTP